MQDIAIAILAAGSSSRMGTPKQQLLIGGKTFLQLALDAALGTQCNTVLLVTADTPLNIETENVAGSRVRFLLNLASSEGIASSIRRAVKEAQTMPAIDRLLFMNCDQPDLSSAALLKLISCHHKGAIVASSFAGVLGTPAIFDKVFFAQLLELRGDVGAKSIIKSNRENLIECDLLEGSLDVDTPADFELLLHARRENVRSSPN